jgi:multicomponent Na+:H+ antiporter subunit E
MKQKLLLNFLLAIVWAALTGALSPQNFLIGFILGYGIIFLFQPLLGADQYGSRIVYWFGFLLWFVKELFVSSIRVAIDVLTPVHRMNPGVIAVPLDVSTDAEITFLANTISLTPGTLSLDVSQDRKTLYIHAMYIRGGDIEAEKLAIKRDVERRVRIALGTLPVPDKKKGLSE